MLRLAEIDSGAMKTRFTAVNLAGLVERVADAFRPDIESTGRSLRVDTGHPLDAQGDAQLLAQAVSNLLDNALRHTPAGAQIVIALTETDGGARLSVTDNGLGVAPVDANRLVQPFECGDPSRSAPGSGLGLSIVAAIARLHDGAFSLENAEPGLRAVITLPASAA
jgi:signal transduction histidine kinase